MQDDRAKVRAILEGSTKEAQVVLQRVLHLENEYLHQKQPQKMDAKIVDIVKEIVHS